MAKIIPSSVSNVTGVEDLKRFSDILFQSIIQQVNGNLSFTDNLSVSFLDVSFTSTSTETAFSHTLGRVPVMWIVGNQSASGSVYQTKGATDKLIYLASSAVLTAKIVLV